MCALPRGRRSRRRDRLGDGGAGSGQRREPSPSLELVRLAVPRRVYSARQLEHAADAAAEVVADAEAVRGLRDHVRGAGAAALHGALRARLSRALSARSCTPRERPAAIASNQGASRPRRGVWTRPGADRIRPVQTLRRTPLYERHAALGARLVPFAGWEMPVQYTSIVRRAPRGADDGRRVRRLAHGRARSIAGDGAHDYLQARLSNDLDRAGDGRRAVHAAHQRARAGSSTT